MAAQVSKVQVSLLDDRISILDTSVADNSPLKQVFRTVSAIIALVRVSSFSRPLMGFLDLIDDLTRTR